MGRKSVAQLENELAQERDDNARLYMKVENLRAEIAELEESDDANDSDASDESDDAGDED